MRWLLTWFRWLFRRRRPVSTYQLTTSAVDAVPLIDSAALATRLTPTRASTQYRVVVDFGNKSTDVYRGPSGAHARQVYERLHPKVGEIVRFWDGDACRGCKT